MNACMAERKKKPEPPKKPRPGVQINVWILDELAERIEEYIEASSPRPSLTAVVRAALEEWLDARQESN